MFSRSRKAQAVPTVVAGGCQIIGDVTHDGELHLEGVVVGKIRCQRLVVTPGGSVSGDVEAEAVSVAGSIRGEIVTDSLDAAATAEIHGNIHCNELAIARGARINGKINRRPGAVPAVVPPLPDLAVTEPPAARLSLAISN